MDLVRIRKKAQMEKGKKNAPEPPSTSIAPPVIEQTSTRELEPRIPVVEGEESVKSMQVLVPSQDKEFLEIASEELYKQSYALKEPLERLELLCFRLSTEEYAFPITEVKEIIKPMEITEVPRVPEYILGIISLRGTIVPICDLRRRLGLPVKEATRSTRIVIASDDVKTLGMVVDEVTEVMRIPVSGLEPPPPVLAGVGAEFIQAVGRDNHKMVILLNMKKIFDMDISSKGRL